MSEPDPGTVKVFQNDKVAAIVFASHEEMVELTEWASTLPNGYRTLLLRKSRHVLDDLDWESLSEEIEKEGIELKPMISPDDDG